MEASEIETTVENLEVEKGEKSESEEKTLQLEEPDKTENTPEVHTGKKNKEEKLKKKDDKSVEDVLKALNNIGTGAMCQKYADIVDKNKKLQLQVKQYEKKLLTLQREKEQLQSEQQKTVLTRSRLESLCRELQKQNKQIKEGCLQRIKDEEEKRKSISRNFQSTLGEISLVMQQNYDNNSKLRDENLEMQNKFKTVCEQYELRGQQVEKLSQQMKLESQLAEAKLTKLKIEMAAEKELLENEKKQLLMELAAYQHKCQELQKAEMTLKNQINVYTEKYDEFQGALAKSNKLYGGFKAEMGQMSNKIAKLEKETSVWKMRCENNRKTLLEVAAEKQQKAAELSLASKQLAQLQKLCRTLQADRTSLLMQLKSQGITPNLSRECNSGNENDSESRPDGKLESSPPPESEVLENLKDHELSPMPENGDFEAVQPKESTTTDGNSGKGNEIPKTEGNAKKKKGKEGSKRRKK